MTNSDGDIPEQGVFHVSGITPEGYDKLRPDILAAGDGKQIDELSSVEVTYYEQLSRQEQKKFQKPVSKTEWQKLITAKNKITDLRKQLFISVMDIPDVDWIVKGLVVREGITLLFGDAGVGKTSLILQLIDHLAEGKEFLGLPTQQADVLLIEQDEGKTILRSHIEKMVPVCPSLRWLEIPTVTLVWDNTNQDFAEKGMVLKKLIALTSPSVVIIDSLTSLGIADINHPSSSLLFDRVRQVAEESHCAFVLLHHPNKNGDIMGSNLIRAKVDCLIQLQKVGQVVKLVPLKVRGESIELSLKQKENTLTFDLIPRKDDWIWQLHIQGKKPKEIADIVAAIYEGTTANSVGVTISRMKDKKQI